MTQKVGMKLEAHLLGGRLCLSTIIDLHHLPFQIIAEHPYERLPPAGLSSPARPRSDGQVPLKPPPAPPPSAHSRNGLQDPESSDATRPHILHKSVSPSPKSVRAVWIRLGH